MSLLNDKLECMQTDWAKVDDDWANIRSRWPDSVGDEFALRFWRNFQQEIPDYLRALRDLAEAYSQSDDI